MSLVTQLTTLNRRLAGLPTRFGVPQYVTVVLEAPDGSQTLVEPNPKVEGVGQNRIGSFLSDSVQISGSELVVSGISREYPEDLVSTARYLIGPELTEVAEQVPVLDQNGNPTFDLQGNQVTTEVLETRWVGGTRCTCEYVDTRKMTTWTVIISPRYTR